MHAFCIFLFCVYLGVCVVYMFVQASCIISELYVCAPCFYVLCLVVHLL